jgi:hypothetical protein
VRAHRLSVGLLLSLSAVVAGSNAGCGSGGGSSSGGSAAAGVASGTTSPTPSSTTSGTSSGTTTTPGGTTTTPAPTGPDTAPPVITLTSPARGLHTTLNMVRVEGTVTDQTGVAYFIVNGTPVLPGANGAFLHVVTLGAGLNVIELEAADPLGKRARTVLPVVSGAFLPEASNVSDALGARLNRPAFDAIERLAAQQLGGVNLAAMIMAQNPLFSGSYGLANVDVRATSATFGTPALDLDPQAGGLAVRVELPAIDVSVRAEGRVIGIPFGIPVQITADRAIVTARAVVTVAPGGVVTTALQNVVVDLQNFRFDIGGIPTFLENLARTAVRDLIARQIVRQVETIVPQEVNRAIAGANGPITQVVMGRTVTLHLLPKAVTFDPDGCSVLCDGDMRLPAVAGLPTTPGSLFTTGAAPAHATTPAFHLSLNDDMLNRVGHAAWRGGLMNLLVDQTTAQTLGLPAWLPMDAFMLQVFFPQLIGRVNPLDPLELEVSSATPAMFRTLPAGQGLLEAGIGDLTVSIFVAPAGRPRELVMRVGTQVRVGIQTSLQGTTLRVDVVGRPTIRTDVFETPLVALDEVAVENFVDFILPPVIQVLPRAFSGFPLPMYPGITPSNVQAVPDGPMGDFVTVKGDL